MTIRVRDDSLIVWGGGDQSWSSSCSPLISLVHTQTYQILHPLNDARLCSFFFAVHLDDVLSAPLYWMNIIIIIRVWIMFAFALLVLTFLALLVMLHVFADVSLPMILFFFDAISAVWSVDQLEVKDPEATICSRRCNRSTICSHTKDISFLHSIFTPLTHLWCIRILSKEFSLHGNQSPPSHSVCRQSLYLILKSHYIPCSWRAVLLTWLLLL